MRSIGIVALTLILVEPSGSAQQAPNISPEQLQSPAAQAWVRSVYSRRERLDRLTRQLEALGETQGNQKQLPIALACGLMLESAFPMSITDLGHKKDNGQEAFHLLLSGGSDGVFDLMYFYSQKGLLLGSSIQHVPKDWVLLLSNLGGPTDHKMSLVTSPRQPGKESCSFEFDLFEPFAAKVQ